MADGFRIDKIGINDKHMKGFGSINTEDKKLKKFDEELSGQLSGNPIRTAYMPDIGNIGGLLNGSKGAGQAATQV